jgi:hypothetical protein
MEQKKLITMFMFIGSIVGGYIPSLWDASLFSMSSLFLSALGGFLGIWAGYKLGE